MIERPRHLHAAQDRQMRLQALRADEPGRLQLNRLYARKLHARCRCPGIRLHRLQLHVGRVDQRHVVM